MSNVDWIGSPEVTRILHSWKIEKVGMTLQDEIDMLEASIERDQDRLKHLKWMKENES